MIPRLQELGIGSLLEEKTRTGQNDYNTERRKQRTESNGEGRRRQVSSFTASYNFLNTL